MVVGGSSSTSSSLGDDSDAVTEDNDGNVDGEDVAVWYATSRHVVKAARLLTLRLVLLADSLNVWSSSRVHHVLFASQVSRALALVEGELIVVCSGVLAGDVKCFDRSRNSEGENMVFSPLLLGESDLDDGGSAMYSVFCVSKRSLFLTCLVAPVDVNGGQTVLVASTL